MSLLEPRAYYKPFEYPWAYEFWRSHEAMHWMGHEVPLHEDVIDWNTKLTDSEKNLLTHLFRFFTQADLDVACGYNSKFIPYFGGKAELLMMMSSFAARENVHMDAYALLLETVGMPEVTYQQFQEYKEMVDKHDFVGKFGMETPSAALRSLAIYSAFTEGVQLFASFIVLLNFARHNKMKNMGNIITWSLRDEDLHVDGMTTLFREFAKELPKADSKDLMKSIREPALRMIELEDNFIDLIFSESDAIEGLTPDEVKYYIRFIANKRWQQLGFSNLLYPTHTVNNLPWVDFMINGEEHTNFFEQKSTAYSKAMTKGTMEEIEW